MKLLFDENLSYRLRVSLEDIFPDSTHVRDVGLLGAADARVWEYAAAHDFLLTSKDTDFYQRSLLFGAPPRIIWLRVGNVFNGRHRGTAAQLVPDDSTLCRRSSGHSARSSAA